MKNWFVKSLLCVAVLAVAAFAQVPAAGKKTEAVPAKEKYVESDEPLFAVELHPLSLITYPLFWDNPSFYATVEAVINTNASIITRPFYSGKRISKKHESGYIDVFGLSEGFRYYFDRKHVGWFTSVHFTYEYVKLIHKYDDSRYDNLKDSGNGIALSAYLGRKYRLGTHFVTSLDIGAVYSQVFIDKDGQNDVEDVTNIGIGIDINYTIGFTF
ncbi:MAG: DUF3575 domain-containing protein [Fibrobacter sp.]|nr:DUF3575 domain-containing protein [Fibrobacter sp.]